MRRIAMRNRPGLTLIEMIVSLLIFSFVTAGAMLLLRSESRAFSLGSEGVAMYQNGRFAMNEMEKDLRTSGAGAPDMQPQLIYIADSVMMFNANYWTNTAGDVEAVYYNPDAPDSAVAAMRTSSKITIPYTAIQYPDTNYLVGGVNSASETILFYFRADSSTAATNDYILWRRVNNLAPEVVATNIRRTTGRAFFEYFRVSTTAAGVSTMSQVAANLLPWRHSVPIHLSNTDIANAARIDSIRAVRVNFTVTNGATGANERTRALTRFIRLPNAGLANTKSCGDAPLFAASPVADTLLLNDSTIVVELSFAASVDQAGGEEDVERYVVWRRLSTDTDWGDPYVTLPGDTDPILFVDSDVVQGVSYIYSISAQDCTPTLSGRQNSNTVAVPVIP
jgi:prepilin-type N-terminal cleavage/methylation domain-containing protein